MAWAPNIHQVSAAPRSVSSIKIARVTWQYPIRCMPSNRWSRGLNICPNMNMSLSEPSQHTPDVKINLVNNSASLGCALLILILRPSNSYTAILYSVGESPAQTICQKVDTCGCWVISGPSGVKINSALALMWPNFASGDL